MTKRDIRTANRKKTTINWLVLITMPVGSLIVLSIVALTSVNIAYAQSTNQSSASSPSSSTPPATTATSDKSGTIGSVQNGPDGKPAWNLSGTWNFKYLNSNSPAFTATFGMIKLDGSAAHKHNIIDFKPIANPIKNSSGTSYIGTATISMIGGLVSNIPITITLSNDGDLSIIVDPRTTNFHFGNTPIQGKIITPLSKIRG